MLKPLTLLLSLFFLCACSNSVTKEQLLTKQPWTINKVEYLETGEWAPSYINQGSLWTFSEDYKASFSMNNDFQQTSIHGNWELKADSLYFNSPMDSSVMLIEELTDSNLNWIWTAHNLKFYLIKYQERD
ncbi:hypothetical protein [Croceimicrobium hydrocarbonivorans]|uniref:Lipocalin-like domain-containing protein n=1 Tax=Croceimicrobium hydrocarbonivorans TaxID=2761580 RepID=A0A7H0VEC2_9FLAO|nr:hypothetical protein [Croceimicrobium hydrocarbonivorans]QNR24070.1 hypothetical protein H4K34_17115 [Croceimicrobium hydrocarbonivorans]